MTEEIVLTMGYLRKLTETATTEHWLGVEKEIVHRRCVLLARELGDDRVTATHLSTIMTRIKESHQQ